MTRLFDLAARDVADGGLRAAAVPGDVGLCLPLRLEVNDELCPVHAARISASRYLVNRLTDATSYKNPYMATKPDWKTFGSRLRWARNNVRPRKMTQQELARASGIKQPTISDIENGEAQSSGSTARLAAALRVNALWLETGRGLPGVEADGTSQAANESDALQEAPPNHRVDGHDPLLNEIVTLFEGLAEKPKVLSLALLRVIHAHEKQPEKTPQQPRPPRATKGDYIMTGNLDVPNEQRNSPAQKHASRSRRHT